VCVCVKLGRAIPYNDQISINSQLYSSQGMNTPLDITSEVNSSAAVFTASWSTTSTSLLVDSITSGTIQVGQYLSGRGISSDTYITNIGPGKDYARYSGPYDTIIPGKQPWGIYHAKDYNPSKKILPEARGNGFDAIGQGSISKTYAKGFNATNYIFSINGDVNTKLTWPAYAFDDFTICSITRYTSNLNQRRIITNTDATFVHGHYLGLHGFAYYRNTAVTNANGISGDAKNWLVLCGKTEGNIPNNILANNLQV